MAPENISQAGSPNWGKRIFYLLLVVIIGGLLGYGVWRNNQEEEAKRAEHSRIMQELQEKIVEHEYNLQYNGTHCCPVKCFAKSEKSFGSYRIAGIRPKNDLN